MLPRVQHETVVQTRPGLADPPPALEYDVIDASTSQLARRCQSGGTGADDDGVMR
jgi:hypothetical protein